MNAATASYLKGERLKKFFEVYLLVFNILQKFQMALNPTTTDKILCKTF